MHIRVSGKDLKWKNAVIGMNIYDSSSNSLRDGKSLARVSATSPCKIEVEWGMQKLTGPGHVVMQRLEGLEDRWV